METRVASSTIITRVHERWFFIKISPLCLVGLPIGHSYRGFCSRASVSRSLVTHDLRPFSIIELCNC